VLILPPGHAQQVRLRRPISKRERWMIAGVLATLGALAIGLVIALATPGPKSGRGCIYLTYAGPVGGQQISQCGASARALCQSPPVPGSLASQVGPALATECRKAGLPTAR
jgi:hypothetical protein